MVKASSPCTTHIWCVFDVCVSVDCGDLDICDTENATWLSLSLFLRSVLIFTSLLCFSLTLCGKSYLTQAYMEVCACVRVFFLETAVLFLCCLSAQFLPEAQGGDGEDCHHSHQREWGEDQGPGEWHLLDILVYLFYTELTVAYWADSSHLLIFGLFFYELMS